MLTRSRRLLDDFQVARFGAVGLGNTAIGYLVIIAALSLGVGDVPANAAGYAFGLIVSYILNSRWIFRDGARAGQGAALRYAAVFIIAYGANLAIVLLGRQFGYPENPLVHLAASIAYVALFYIGAARFVFGDQLAATRRNILDRRWPELLALCILAVAWAAMCDMAVTHDVVWQMWIARQLLGGASLYSDIMELNPPLWFWLAMPVQKAAVLFGLVPKHAMIAAIFIYVAVSLLALAALSADLDPRRRAVLLGVAVIAMVIVPIPDFAQREHIALIAAIPYCALAARRADGRAVAWQLAVTVGLLSATGFALKHYFVAVPVLIEFWLLWRLRKRWRPLRPETMVLGGAAILYVAAIAVMTPAYFSTIVPMVKLAYFGYQSNLPYQLVKAFVVFWLLAGWVLFSVRKDVNSLAITTFVAGAGFVLSYFAQQKGWSYHAMPASALVFVGLGSILPVDRLPRPSLRIVVGAMIMPLLIVAVSGPYRNSNRAIIEDLLQGVGRGKPVMILAVNPSRLWPMNEDAGYVWPSRNFAMWMLAAFAYQLRNEGQLSPDMQELARRMRADTVVDLACNPPDVILVDDLLQSKARGIDAVEFFSRDEDFRAFFSHYDRARTRENFTTYVKRPGWEPAGRPAACRVLR